MYNDEEDSEEFFDSPPFTGERPHFGRRQVRTVAGVRPGKTYLKVNLIGKRRVMVLENPYEKTPGSWWVRVHYLRKGFEDTISLADCGVTPYMDRSGSVWNSTNYLLRA